MNIPIIPVFKTKIKKEEKPSCIVPEKEQLRAEEMEWSLTGGEAKHIEGRCLAIDGIANAIEFLGQIENGSAVNFDFLELRTCNESCAGGILTTANRFLTSERLHERALKYNLDKSEGKIFDNKSIDRHIDHVIDNIMTEAIEPRSMLKLDDDMEKAMSLGASDFAIKGMEPPSAILKKITALI
mgnify:CR=1 FL=1